MEKTEIVLVVWDKKSLKNAVKKLKFGVANLTAIISDGHKEKIFHAGKRQFPIFSFAQIQQPAKRYSNALWMIGDNLKKKYYLRRMKKFLTASGVPEDNIFNLDTFDEEIFSKMSETWRANVKHVEENGADFFATGNESMCNGLHLEFIPRVYRSVSTPGGANLADGNQTLKQSYLTAKHIFEHVAPRTVKFVLIGLTPESFIRDDKESAVDFQFIFKFKTSPKKVDLNFDAKKKSYRKAFSAKAIADWKDEIKLPKTDADSSPDDNAAPEFRFVTNTDSEDDNKNIKILKDYIQLCLDNGAQPVGVIFPVAQAMRKNYDEKILTEFRETIRHLEETSKFLCIDMFDVELDYDCFCDMAHLNKKGMRRVNALLSARLCNLDLIPLENFCDMTYEYFNAMSYAAPKEEYHALIDRVFEKSAQRISRKRKINIGFVLYLSAEWCGDNLYNLFLDDDRFETTIFLCMRVAENNNELFRKDFLRGIEQFKSRNLKVFPVDGEEAKIPPQNVLVFLIPYFTHLPKVFRPENIITKTLIVHITYSFSMAIRSSNYHNRNIFRTSWKVFFASVIARDVHRKACKIGLPRGIYSGYPRTDIFFEKNSNLQFPWKMAHPDAKKIIWAPHWSIGESTHYATFQWNYQFMYDFAKAHPEISWIVKPHPGLFFAAVKEKVFPDIEAFKEYLRNWHNLPNALVYTGGYYQAIFATSDGMIQDCSSFIAEYQFVDNPMIYLTRAGEKFNPLGTEILKVSYTVDGKDFDAIAATIQRVFIEGDDYKAAERREVFDKYLNYPKLNGMPASEFIYKNIADDVKGES